MDCLANFYFSLVHIEEILVIIDKRLYVYGPIKRYQEELAFFSEIFASLLGQQKETGLATFEHPQSVRDLIQEKVKLETTVVTHGVSFDRNNATTCGDIGAIDIGNRFLIRIPAKRMHTGQKDNKSLAMKTNTILVFDIRRSRCYDKSIQEPSQKWL